jgi:hypothetical protein
MGSLNQTTGLGRGYTGFPQSRGAGKERIAALGMPATRSQAIRFECGRGRQSAAAKAARGRRSRTPHHGASLSHWQDGAGLAFGCQLFAITWPSSGPNWWASFDKSSSVKNREGADLTR